MVTNRAIDREREVEHFSTRIVLGRRPPIEGVEPDPPQRCELRMPIILGGMRPGVQVSLPELRRVAAGQGAGIKWGHSDSFRIKRVECQLQFGEICRIGEDQEVNVLANLRRAVEHAGLPAHEQRSGPTRAGRRKDMMDRGRDQGCLPWRDIG